MDVSRGDLIVTEAEPCEIADQFEAKIFWMDKETGYVGRDFKIKIGTSLINAKITKIKYAIDVNNKVQATIIVLILVIYSSCTPMVLEYFPLSINLFY